MGCGLLGKLWQKQAALHFKGRRSASVTITRALATDNRKD
jgi:hypothetical protein